MNYASCDFDNTGGGETAPYSGGGCLVGAFLPIFAVLVVGAALAYFALTYVAPQMTYTADNSSLLAEYTLIENIAAEDAAEAQGSRKSSGKLANVFTPEVLYWKKEIVKWANEWDLDPNLVATVMQIESCGDPLARSHAGASGLFQVMPFHFKAGEDPYDPNTNALRGMAYLAQALSVRNGDVRLALAGYNGGIARAARPESQWAAETIRYVYWGSGIYADAVAGKQHSPRLQEWLNAGGAGLCRQANARLELMP